MKMISLKVPDDVLERLDLEAHRKGISRTALLLDRWTEAKIVSEYIEQAKTPAGVVQQMWNAGFKPDPRIGCKSCGSLGGLHQKGCKG